MMQPGFLGITAVGRDPRRTAALLMLVRGGARSLAISDSFLEHLPRHRDLGDLERDVAPLADDLSADLDQPLARAGQRLKSIRSSGR